MSAIKKCQINKCYYCVPYLLIKYCPIAFRVLFEQLLFVISNSSLWHPQTDCILEVLRTQQIRHTLQLDVGLQELGSHRKLPHTSHSRHL